MGQIDRKTNWSRKEALIARARFEGQTKISSFSYKGNRPGCKYVPIEVAANRSSIVFDSLRRHGSYGCTVNRLA